MKKYLFIYLLFFGCEDKDDSPGYCDIAGPVWFVSFDRNDIDYVMAWTTNDDKADFRMKYTMDFDKNKSGYWFETNLDIYPNATIIRTVSPGISNIPIDFYCRNTTLSDLPAGCK